MDRGSRARGVYPTQDTAQGNSKGDIEGKKTGHQNNRKEEYEMFNKIT